jgi:hypothetical protein
MSTRFHWGLPGLNRDRFGGYATLLYLINGGQVEEPTEKKSQSEYGVALSEYNEADSIVTQNISSIDDIKLREAFLD